MAKPPLITVRSPGSTATRGLRHLGRNEIEFRYRDDALAGAARDLADTILHSIESGARIASGQTMGFASSILSFSDRDGVLCASALDVQRDVFVPFIDDLLFGWNLQLGTCKLAESKYIKTDLADTVVISPGVLQQTPIREAIRYPFVALRSGWWLLGGDYDGDLKRVITVHVGDILSERHDVHRYLALETGFVVSLSLGYTALMVRSRDCKRGPKLISGVVA